MSHAPCGGAGVAVWHVLTKGQADRFADPERVARKMMNHAYDLGRANRPAGQSVGQYVRQQLDRLALGQTITTVPHGTARTVKLGPTPIDSG